MEEIEKALREMFEVFKPIAFNKPTPSQPRGEYFIKDQLKAAEVCAQIAIAIVEIREQRSEEGAE